MNPVLRSNLFAMIIIILSVIGSIFVGIILTQFNLPMQYSIVFTEVLFYVVPTIIYFLITRLPVKETLKLNSMPLPTILITILIGILIYPMSIFIANLSQLLFHNFLQDAVTSMQPKSFIGFIGAIALTPAICEELVMRGVLFSGYNKINIKKAALMNGLFFGILHLNLQQFFYAFIIGVILTYVVDATKSLYSSMIAHFMCNGVSALLMYFVMDIVSNSEITEAANTASIPLAIQIISLVIQFIIFIACLTFIILLIKALYSITGKREIAYRAEMDTNEVPMGECNMETQVVKSERVLNWPFYVTLGFFLVVIIILEISKNFGGY